MARIAKVKKREVSFRSRAARRGASPTAPVSVKPTAEKPESNAWIHSAQGAGISKKKKTKQLSRAQKARHQKGLEFGERNVDKLERKVADSKARARRVDARRAGWEETNEAAVSVLAKQGVKPSDSAPSASKSEKPAKGPHAMDDVQIEGATEPVTKNISGEAMVTTEEPVKASVADIDIDEIT